MAKKPVRFDYFEVTCRKHDHIKNFNYDARINLGPILKQAGKLGTVERTFSFADEEARLQTTELLKDIGNNKHIWGMQFIRIRKNARPAIARDDGSFEYMNLREDEFIGEEAAALFDSELCIIMIQRNRDSLSPAGIQLFFNQAYINEDIRFKPLIPQDVIERIKNKEYRGISIGLTNLRNSNLQRKSILNVIKGIEKFNSVNAEIRLTTGMPRKDQAGLDPDEVMETVEQLQGISEVTKLEVKVVEDDLKVRPYDLIQERLHDIIPFSYSKEEQLNYNRVIECMLKTYYDRRPEIQKLLK